MQQDELKALFDQQAASYDTQWAKTAPIRHCLHLLLGSMFAELPEEARILCVGVGTGDELFYLASRHPGWHFTALEPSGAMLEVCRRRAEEEGVTARCDFHEGYLGSLAPGELHDAATCFLVSHFMLDQGERSGFFREIAQRLKPGGLLASSDLASDVAAPHYEVLLRAWMNMMSAADLSEEALTRMRTAYAKDVGMLPPAQVASLIEAGGFERVTPFFQAGLIHAWLSTRSRAVG
ncbi:class I SAM-dependent methyltransferase [Stutzerimonas stutzeri]